MWNSPKYRNRFSARFFPERTALSITTIDFVGKFSTSSQGYQIVLFILDHYFKITRETLASKTTALHASIVVMYHCLITNNSPTYLPANGGKPSVSLLFAGMCAQLRLKDLATTAYYPHTNGHAKQLYQSFLNSLRPLLAVQ